MSWLSSILGSDDAKLAQRTAQRGVKQQEDQYATLAPFRSQATQFLGDATGAHDFSSDYEDPTNPFLTGDSFVPITNGRYQGALDSSVQSLTAAPDRMALVMQALADYDTANTPAFQARLRAVGQKAAATGRLGAGMTTSELGDVGSEYERNRLLTANDLIRDATSQTLADRLAQVSALRGVNQDSLAALRGERDFERGLGQDAVASRVAQRATERGAVGEDLGNAVTAVNVGYGNQPDYTPLAQVYQNNANAKKQAVAALFGQAVRAMAGGGSGGGAPS